MKPFPMFSRASASRRFIVSLLGLLCLCTSLWAAATPRVSDREPETDGIGYLPREGETVAINPPPLTWLREPGAVLYTVEIAPASPTPDFSAPVVRATTPWLMYAHTAALHPDRYAWRYRFEDKASQPSTWSRVRVFTIAAETPEFARPTHEALARAVPRSHPRAFFRPEKLAELRASATTMTAEFAALKKAADASLRVPIMLQPKPWADNTWNMKEWLKYYGEITTASRVLQDAGFAYAVSGDPKYAARAREWMLAFASWDPDGPTSVNVNDEQTMAIVVSTCRAYSWTRDRLSPADAAAIRAMMRARCAALYRHLRRAPYEQFPYDSHSGRIWHMLGEAAMIFYDEIPEAPEWLDYAMTIFHGWYPIWGDPDGGWAEGLHYWTGYNEFISTWLDELRGVLGIDGSRKPFYAHVADFPMYVGPPGGAVGGFGDFSEARPPKNRGRVAAAFATARHNPEWQWYAQAVGWDWQPAPMRYLAAFQAKPVPRPPAPASVLKVFAHAGWAVFNSALTDAANNVQFHMRSSPYGNVSHSHSDQNNIVLGAFGSPLLVNTGMRDHYGSDFCKGWYWATVGHNCVLLGGEGQGRGLKTKGAIEASGSGPAAGFAWAVGNATPAYGGGARLMRRYAAFVRGETMVLLDDVDADTTGVDLMFHGRAPFTVDAGGQRFALTFEKAALDAWMFAPAALRFEQTDRYTIQPEPTVKPVPEWHLKASLARGPGGGAQAVVTLLDVHRAGAPAAITNPKVAREGNLVRVEWTRAGKTQRLEFDRTAVKVSFTE